MPTALTQGRLKEYIRDIPDFPKKGILFKDITPLLRDAEAFHASVTLLSQNYASREIDAVVGIESRGFIFASAVAANLRIGLVPVRKKGKLPWTTEKVTYQLEYGEDTLEIHKDAIAKGSRVLIIDDLLATGGTALAVCQLIQKLGGSVEGIGCLIELGFLGPRDRLKGYDIFSLIQY
jgi:adenine phosphoribosyltransferase